MLFNRHFFAAAISSVAVLAELLVVMLGAVPYAASQIHLELVVASYSTMIGLGIMAAAAIALIVWRVRGPDLPRAPNTLAGVVSYVSDSRMVEDFEGCEYMDDTELNGKLGRLGKTYGFGRRPGSDGEQRHLVDEETTTSYAWRG
jgi:hypothetical protein